MLKLKKMKKLIKSIAASVAMICLMMVFSVDGQAQNIELTPQQARQEMLQKQWVGDSERPRNIPQSNVSQGNKTILFQTSEDKTNSIAPKLTTTNVKSQNGNGNTPQGNKTILFQTSKDKTNSIAPKLTKSTKSQNGNGNAPQGNKTILFKTSGDKANSTIPKLTKSQN